MAVNQILPCWSATSPCGPDSGVFSGYSLNSPVFGSRRPSLLAICPVYQSEPSGATAGSCGRALGVGTSHSLMETLAGDAATHTAATASTTAHRNALRDFIVGSLMRPTRSGASRERGAQVPIARCNTLILQDG